MKKIASRQRGRVSIPAVIFLVTVVVVVVSVWLKYHNAREEADFAEANSNLTVQYLPQRVPLPDFRLTDMQGQPLTRENFEGQWTFLYFGYTLCPDVCPTELTALHGVLDLLRADEGVGELPQAVFVSVDPDRDSPEQIGKFVTYFDEHIRGATGEEAQLRQLTRPLGVAYEKVPLPGVDPSVETDAYLVNHHTSILLIGPQARMHAVFPTPHVPSAMVEEFKRILQREE